MRKMKIPMQREKKMEFITNLYNNKRKICIKNKLEFFFFGKNFCNLFFSFYRQMVELSLVLNQKILGKQLENSQMAGFLVYNIFSRRACFKMSMLMEFIRIIPSRQSQLFKSIRILSLIIFMGIAR